MTSSAPAGRTPRRPVPQQLPADIDTFAGRHSHLKELTGALRASVVVVHGPAGVGKTALAVHWAHSVRKHFRDGQLYVDLRGYGPAGSALEVGDAVRGFLDALGVPAHQLPSTLPAQLTLYRSLVADKNVLVVLDNARDEQQARALLPGGSPGLALVTSRNQLTGLIAAESARPIGLGVLTDDEARQFFAMRVGHDRVAAEEKAVDDVIALCGRLPLALAIASARSVTNPTFSFAALADELRATDGTLDAFVAGDPTVDVRAVFSWSLRALSGDAAAVFRTLAAHPGPDLTIPAAASLAGLPARRLRLILRELSRANLLGERVPGRFVMHDLVRAYAAELDTGTNARTAQRRLLDHYVRTAQHAVRLLDPGQHFADVPPEPGVVPETPADPAAAVGWLTAEYPNLLAAVRFASRERFQTHTWDLAVTLWVYLDQQARWHDMINTETAALAAVRALTDGAKQAAVHHGLGYIYLELDRYDEARHELRTALDLFEAAGEPAEQASVLITLAYVPGDGVRHAQEALELFRSIGDVAGAANALHTLATLYRRAGELDRALAHGHEALAVLDGTDHDRVLAKTLRTVGDIHQDRGEYADAIEWYERALDLQRRLGLRYSVADTLAHLGDTYRGMEDLDDARSAWREAVAVLDDLGHPSADDVRAKLR